MVHRIGGVKDLSVDIRVIAVTNRNLLEAVRAGAFRQDLYYRLNVIQIYIPTLRERPEDILPLVQFFIAHYNKKFKRKILGISPEAEKLLQRYHWPGNVRELRNAIERAMILEDASHLQVPDLPIALNRAEFPPVSAGVEIPRNRPLARGNRTSDDFPGPVENRRQSDPRRPPAQHYPRHPPL